jgi:hypothetical protein
VTEIINREPYNEHGDKPVTFFSLFSPRNEWLLGYCSCSNPQSCRCRASQPAHWQGGYSSGHPRLFTSHQTPSRASIASPFTPRSRGRAQHHHTGTYNSYSPYNPNAFYDNPHMQSTMYSNPPPHLNLPTMTPPRLHPRLHGPQRHAIGPPSVPFVPSPTIHQQVHQPLAGARGLKRKSTEATAPKRPKRTRIPASLNTGPVAARCGVGPPSLPVPDDGPVPPTTVLPAVSQSPTSLPTASYPSLSQNRRPTKQHSATDCWYFVQAVESNVKPTDPPLQSESDLTSKALTEKPKGKTDELLDLLRSMDEPNNGT